MPTQIISKGGIQEAPPDPGGGPRWLARLDDGTIFTGKPSWMGNSGSKIRMPNVGQQPASDWRRLQVYCEENKTRIKSLSLYCNGRWFHSDENAGAYGYFEVQVTSMKAHKPHKSGVEALAICWPARDTRNGRMRIKVLKIFASGLYEEWWRDQWLPCMTGPPEAEKAFKDEGILYRSAVN